MNILIALTLFVPSIAQKFAEYVNITSECKKAIEYKHVSLNKVDKHIIKCENGVVWEFIIRGANMEVIRVRGENE